MHVRKLDPQDFVAAYDAAFQFLYPWEGVVETPFGAAWGLVKPGERTRSHMHHEGETFFIVRGRGTLKVGEESRSVSAGDMIFLPPLNGHELTNTAEEDLLFLTIYWEDLKLLSERPRRETAAAGHRPRQVLVTATPPTPNGDLHVGHLSGPYLAADIHTRYLRLRGVPARYLSATDDHQSYVTLKGEQLGTSSRDTADRFGERMVSTLEEARIELDWCARPARPTYPLALVQRFFAELWEKGHLVAREAPSLFCEPCGRQLFGAFVGGRCPHCGAGSNGNSCEVCGRPNDCVDLLEPRCNRCGGRPEVRPLERIFFPLGRFEEDLRRYHASVAMSPHLRALCDGMLADGLPDIAASHAASWGVPVPVEGFEDQRIFEWLEMAPGYLAATQEMGEVLGGPAWPELWSAEDTEIVQFFGFDNGYYHAVLFPALFFAWDRSIRPPRTFVTNEFYRLEGAKFSTSRGHAVWGSEILERLSPDVVRFYLAYTNPETEQTNFVESELAAVVRRELSEGWEPWLRQLGEKVAWEYGGQAPATGVWTAQQVCFYDSLGEIAERVGRAYEAATFSPQTASHALCELVAAARRFAASEEHWRPLEKRSDERRTAVALELAAARALALLSLPIMPDFAERLWRALGGAGPVAAQSWEETPDFVPPGQPVGDLAPSFGRAVREKAPKSLHSVAG